MRGLFFKRFAFARHILARFRRVFCYNVLMLRLGLIIMILTAVFAPQFSRAEVSCDANVGTDRTLLEQQMKACEAEVAKLSGTIKELQGKGASYKNEIGKLEAKVKQAQSNITAKNIQISRLSGEIATKEREVINLTNHLDRNKESFAHLMRLSAEFNQATLLEALLSGGSLSDFFRDLDNYEAVQTELYHAASTIKSTRKQKEEVQKELEKKRDATEDAKEELLRAKALHATNQKEQEKLLKVTKNQEQVFAKVKADRQAQIAKIRDALFRLQDDSSVKFGQAYDYALEAERDLNIRPAFLLAIFSQETSFGAFVGGCKITDDEGNGVRIKSGKSAGHVMAKRDVATFKEITTKLYKDPYNTPVSCPAGDGYGGAMGAAQFLPSTWISFVPRVQRIVGAYPNPWIPRHAFLAAARYLADLGADAGGATAEKNAACRYYSGRVCSKAPATATIYANSVLKKAASIQTTMIDPMER